MPLGNFSALSFKNFDSARLRCLFNEIYQTIEELSVTGSQIVDSVLKGNKCTWRALAKLTITETDDMSTANIPAYILNFERKKGVRFDEDELTSLTFNFEKTNSSSTETNNIKEAGKKIAEARNLDSLVITMNGQIVYEFTKPTEGEQSDSDQ